MDTRILLTELPWQQVSEVLGGKRFEYITEGGWKEWEGEERRERKKGGEFEGGEGVEGTWNICSVRKGVKGAIILVIKYTTEKRDCRAWRHSSRPCSPCVRGWRL